MRLGMSLSIALSIKKKEIPNIMDVKFIYIKKKSYIPALHHYASAYRWNVLKTSDIGMWLLTNTHRPRKPH